MVETRVVLDSCVLIPMPLADTLLRLGSGSRLYVPKWSSTIMQEVGRNLVENFGLTPAKAEYREGQIRRHFPEAWVAGFDDLIPEMKNSRKDRHVLAAAVRSNAEVIVTYNLRDFPRTALAPYGVVAMDPGNFLCKLYSLDADTVLAVLARQASSIRQPVGYVLERLAVNVPAFVEEVRRR